MILSINHGMHSLREGRERFTASEAALFLADVGFEGLDVNFFGTTNSGYKREIILDGSWQQNIAELKKVICQCCLKVESIHTPAEYFFLKDSSLRPEYEEKMYRSLEAAGMLGAKYAVIHPVTNLEHTKTLVEESIRQLRPFQEYAQRYNVTLAVENLPCTSPEEQIAIADALGCVCCWDTGHANMRNEDQADSIRKVGNRIKVTHVHDNNGRDDEHYPPFFGTICWESVMKAFRDINYQGFLNFEVLIKVLPEPLHETYAAYTLECGKYLRTLFDNAE